MKAKTTGVRTGGVRKAYEAPAIRVLGSLHALTLHSKGGHHCDMTCFHHGSAA